MSKIGHPLKKVYILSCKFKKQKAMSALAKRGTGASSNNINLSLHRSQAAVPLPPQREVKNLCQHRLQSQTNQQTIISYRKQFIDVQKAMLALTTLPPSEEGGGPALDAGGGRDFPPHIGCFAPFTSAISVHFYSYFAKIVKSIFFTINSFQRLY